MKKASKIATMSAGIALAVAGLTGAVNDLRMKFGEAEKVMVSAKASPEITKNLKAVHKFISFLADCTTLLEYIKSGVHPPNSKVISDLRNGRRQLLIAYAELPPGIQNAYSKKFNEVLKLFNELIKDDSTALFEY